MRICDVMTASKVTLKLLPWFHITGCCPVLLSNLGRDGLNHFVGMLVLHICYSSRAKHTQSLSTQLGSGRLYNQGTVDGNVAL